MPSEASYKKEIMQEYEQIRFRNQQLLNARIHEVREQVPEIADIDARIRDINIDAALASLHEEPVDKEQLTTQTGILIQEKYRILANAGYPADYLSPIYTCDKCKDTGYINNKACECYRQRVVKRQYQNSQLEQNLSQENFSVFRSDFYSDQPDGIHELSPRNNIENIRQSLMQYINGVDAYLQGDVNQKGNILFQGNTGVGKTFLSNCVAKELLDKGYALLYTSAGSLFDRFSDVILNKNQLPGSRDFYHATGECDFLLIDDLGTELTSSVTVSCLYSLINDRLLRRKPTIISTNLSLAEIRGHYSERIFSRICDSYLIYTIYGEDIRFARRKKWQQS